MTAATTVTMMKRSPDPKTKASESQPGEDPPGVAPRWWFFTDFLERGKEGGGERSSARCGFVAALIIRTFTSCCLSVPCLARRRCSKAHTALRDFRLTFQSLSTLLLPGWDRASAAPHRPDGSSGHTVAGGRRGGAAGTASPQPARSCGRAAPLNFSLTGRL